MLGAGATTFDGGINPYDLIPVNLAYSHYKGSLTTPPCSEVIKRFSLDKQVRPQTYADGRDAYLLVASKRRHRVIYTTRGIMVYLA